jgi:hypothetical protein
LKIWLPLPGLAWTSQIVRFTGMHLHPQHYSVSWCAKRFRFSFFSFQDFKNKLNEGKEWRGCLVNNVIATEQDIIQTTKTK